MAVYSHSTIIAVYCDLFGNDHLFHAVAAYYVDDLGRSAAVPAFGADIFAGAAGLFRSGFRSCTAVAALGERSECIQQVKALDHLEILPALLLYKIQKFKGGTGNCPAVFRMVLDFQTVGFCDRFRWEDLSRWQEYHCRG